MKLIPYAFTIKKLGIKVDEQEYDMYDEVLSNGTKCLKLPYGLAVGSERSIELDSSNRLHVHGLIYATSSLRYSDVFCRGYHIYMRVLPSQKDVDRWRRYMNKANVTLEDWWYHQKELIANLEMQYFKANAIYDYEPPELKDRSE